jgi:hypothetical protein
VGCEPLPSELQVPVPNLVRLASPVQVTLEYHEVHSSPERSILCFGATTASSKSGASQHETGFLNFDSNLQLPT